jgi:hypothetical protein
MVERFGFEHQESKGSEARKPLPALRLCVKPVPLFSGCFHAKALNRKETIRNSRMGIKPLCFGSLLLWSSI